MKVLQFLVIFLLSISIFNNALANEKVSLQLQWLHQFQFAGYYAALEKGYYHDAGLEVEIRPGGAGIRHFDEVSEGRATFGVGSSGLLLSYLRGKPLVALAVIFQHSQDILLSKKSSGIRHPIDLVGKRIMMLEGEGNAVFRTMLANEGISLDKIIITPSSYDIDDLVNDKVDVFNSYASNEPYYLLSKGIEVSEINPINYGVDYYGDCLYTSRSELENNLERVKKFRKATLKGWQYALDHKEEIIALILEKYSKQKALAHLRFEANAIEKVVMPKLIEIGHMNPGRWKFMASTYEKLDIIKQGYSLDDFIYYPTPPRYPEWIKLGAYIVAAIMLTATLIVLILVRFNKKLRKVVDNRTKELSEVNVDLRAQIDENQKATEELKLNELRLQTLQKLNSMTSSTEKELTHFAMEAAVRLTRSTVGYIAFVDKDETVLTMYAWSKQAMKECAVIDKPIEFSVVTTGLWGEAVRQRRAIITNNYKAPNPYKKGTPDGHVGIMRHMNAPIFDGDRIVIVAGVGNKSTDYEDDDVRQLTLFMSELWNILRRRRVEDELKVNEKKYRKLIQNISDVIVIMDKEGTNIYKSPNIKEQFGWHPEELIGKSGFSTVHPNDTERLKKEFARLVSGEKLKTRVEYRYLCKDGSYKPVELTAVSLLGDPLINGILANYKDISDRKRSEEILRQSEEKYRTMVERSNDMIWTLDIGGNLTFFNEQTRKTTGLKSEEWLGKSFIPLIMEEDLPMINEVFQKSINGEPVSYELRFKKVDGEILTIAVNTAPIKTNGSIQGIVSFGRDITEQRMLEYQIQQAQKIESIGTLAGGIAHDFNNILFPILGHSEILLDDMPEDSPAKSNARAIYKSSLRAKELVQQILTFSRQENTEIKLMKIQPVLKEALKMIRSTIPTTINIEDEIEPECCPIKADPTQVHQIIMNLMTNSFHAMENSGGTMKVLLSEKQLGKLDFFNPNLKPGYYACLTVKDTGVGIPENIKTKVFDPFFTTKEQGKGTGMGLSVVHGIVNKMNGAINIYSKPNEGTEFNIYLPTERTIHTDEATHIQSTLQGGSERILLVDDEEGVASVEKLLLQRLGYQVISRTNSLEALEIFKTNPDDFDLVVTDFAMPNMPGDKLASEILKIKPDTRIILCTGFSEKITPGSANKIGIAEVLTKPVAMKELAQKIRKVLDYRGL